MPTLTIQLPNLPPVEHVLRDETMTIGRMKGNTIALDDPSVSISHAKITRVNGEFFLKDLNSTNGTMLNGQSIVEARLRDGDQIKFGEVIAHFRGDQPANTASASAQTQPPAVPTPPTPPAPSTTFVSKRLVTQASQSPSPAPTPTPATSTDVGSRRKKKITPIFPLIGIAAAIIVAGVLGWMFFGGGETGKTPDSNATPAAASQRPSAPTKPSSEPLQNASLAELTKLLKSSNPAERRNAAAELHARGTNAKDAVPQLRDALKDSDADVRMWTALALINNKSYDKATIPILIQTLRQLDPMLRQVACLSLAVIPYDGTEKQPVVAALNEVASKDAEADVRDAASSALKIIAPESAPTEK